MCYFMYYIIIIYYVILTVTVIITNTVVNSRHVSIPTCNWAYTHIFKYDIVKLLQ